MIGLKAFFHITDGNMIGLAQQNNDAESLGHFSILLDMFGTCNYAAPLSSKLYTFNLQQ